MPGLQCRKVCCLTSAMTVTTEHWLAVKINVVQYITPVKNENVNIIKLYLFQRRANFNFADPPYRNLRQLCEECKKKREKKRKQPSVIHHETAQWRLWQHVSRQLGCEEFILCQRWQRRQTQVTDGRIAPTFKSCNSDVTVDTDIAKGMSLEKKKQKKQLHLPGSRSKSRHTLFWSKLQAQRFTADCFSSLFFTLTG